jgi:hypothetical protein
MSFSQWDDAGDTWDNSLDSWEATTLSGVVTTSEELALVDPAAT